MTGSNHPLKDVPANSEFGGSHWFACDQPERPADERTLFRTDCEPCRIALNMALQDPGSCWYGQDVPVAGLRVQAALTGKSITIGRRH